MNTPVRGSAKCIVRQPCDLIGTGDVLVHIVKVQTRHGTETVVNIPLRHQQQAGRPQRSFVATNVALNSLGHGCMALRSYSGWQLLTADQIRLLKLSRDNDDQTSFELEVYDIDSAPAFAALSYVCGDGAPSCKLMLNIPRDVATSQTLEDGTWTIFITPNLETTLGQLAHFSRNKKSYLGHDYLWVDAICIDQSNLQEKSLQVASMYKIYTAVREVLICLGQEEDSSSAVIAVLKRVAVLIGYVDDQPAETESAIKDVISEDNVRALATTLKDSRRVHWDHDLPDMGLPVGHHVFWQGLRRLFYREWFWRLWTYREAILARRGYVLCGDQGIPWNNLVAIS